MRRCDAERAYGRALAQLSSVEIPQFADSSLQPTIQSLKDDCARKARATEQFIEAAETDVIDKLRGMLSEQKLRQRVVYTTWHSVEATYYKRLQELRMVEEKNAEAYRNFDEAVSLYDSTHDKMSPDKKRKLDQKICQLFLASKNTDKNYTTVIYRVRTGRLDYIKGLGHVLDMHQKLEEERFNSLTEQIKIFYEKSLEMGKEILKVTKEECMNSMEGVSLEKELQQIIEKHSSEEKEVKTIPVTRPKSKYPELFKKFEDYHLKDSNLANVTLDIIKSAILNSIEVIKDEIPQVFRQILHDCWTSGETSSKRMNEFKELIKSSKGREEFCEALNYYRAKGIFSIPPKSFGPVANLLILVLDEASKVNDSGNAMRILILSQTYYSEVVGKSSKMNKVFLQHEIQSHELWSKKEIWESAMSFDEDEGAASDAFEESKEEKQVRLQNLIFGKLGTFAHNMIQFGTEKETVEEIILKNAEKANLSPSLLGGLKVPAFATVGNYCSIPQGCKAICCILQCCRRMGQKHQNYNRSKLISQYRTMIRPLLSLREWR
eukprot:TRINITY_DN3117_c0_g1_i16.p1 TRINITY_DN3117_c0_g1~~TRINITY_DN3117_c0_g1_i16.p1  ORF type:complete len:549 (-),score=121.43 TRINITY_DN3117_c0_g1_i16:143-1789(-)